SPFLRPVLAVLRGSGVLCDPLGSTRPPCGNRAPRFHPCDREPGDPSFQDASRGGVAVLRIIETSSIHGFRLAAIEDELPVLLRLVIELQLALFAAEVIGRAPVPDHPVRVVRVHGLLAHRVNGHQIAEATERIESFATHPTSQILIAPPEILRHAFISRPFIRRAWPRRCGSESSGWDPW